MYWPEASALGQFQAKAFIYILQASHTAEKFDLSSVKTMDCFSHLGLKGPPDFSPQKVDCPHSVGIVFGWNVSGAQGPLLSTPLLCPLFLLLAVPF